jgi:hypothetical protein
MVSGVKDPSLLAKELNRFLIGRGGEEIPGLEGLDPGKLIQLRDGLKGFLDQFDQSASQSPEIAALANGEGMRAMRELARVASAKVDEQALLGGLRGGFTNPLSALNAANVAGPLALNGANFDPMALNAVAAAALGASARNLSGVGVATPNPVSALFGGGMQEGSLLGRDPGLAALDSVGGGGGFFEDRVFAIMIKIVEDQQKKIEERLKKLQEDAEKAEKGGGKKKGKGGGLGKIVGGVVGVAAPIAGAVVGGPVGAMAGKAVGSAVGGAAGGGGGGAGGAEGGGKGQESRNIEFEKIKFDMQKLSQMQQALSNILNTMDELAKSAIRHIKAG